MRITLVTNLYAPDAVGGAALYTDLAEALREAGEDVRVITTFSYYPQWALRPEDEGCWERNEIVQGVPVRRVRMFVPRRPSGATRLLSDASFLVALLLGGRGIERRPDVVLTACPMLSQCVAVRGMFGPERPTVLIVQDFVVDAALELGILRVPGLGPMLRGLERLALEAGQVVVTISEPMAQKLRAVVGPRRPREVIPNWIHGSLARVAARLGRDAPARAPQRLFYSGNLGVKQGLPGFIEDFAAAGGAWTLQVNGGGAEAERLRAACASEPRIVVGGLLEEEDYLRQMLTATACLITQRPGVGANFLPSKLLPALATGTPVLAVCEADSPLGVEVNEGGFGAVVPPGNRAALHAVLRAWAEDGAECAELGRRARARAAHYGRERIVGRYRSLLRSLGAWESGTIV